MAIYKRILGQHNYNRGRAQNYLNSFLSGSTPRGPYKNMNQSVREAQILDVDLTAFNDDILKLIKKVGDANELRKIIEPAAEVVKIKAKVLAPKAKPRQRDNSIKRYFAPKKLRSDVLYTYKTPKVVGNKTAGKGYGRVSGKYGIGNIKSSIQVISKVKGYKAPIGIVGPVINRKTSVPNPNEKRHNGWYAHIIYGSSRAFGEKVTYKALRQSTGIVFNIISKGVDRYLSKITPTLKKVA